MKIEITPRQRTIILITLQNIGLLSREETGRRGELLRAMYCELAKVTRELKLSKPIPADGYQKKKNGDHQWPIDASQKWQALK